MNLQVEQNKCNEWTKVAGTEFKSSAVADLSWLAFMHFRPAEKSDIHAMKSSKFWGWGLVISSLIPWLLIPTLPWWPLSNPQRVLASGGLLVSAEVLFWLGALIVGKQAVDRYRQYFTLGNIKSAWQRLCRR